ncbi:MAG: hypothetical protein ACI4EN_09665 [Butyrivibrio sp.]
MKKIKFLSLMFLVCMLLTACQQGNIHENPIGTPEENGSTGEGETVDTSGMVWFPKSAKGTSEDGTVLAGIETEFDNSKLIYKYLMYSGTRTRYYGFEAGYENDKVTKYFELTGNKSEDGETQDKTEKVIEYVESENTLYEKEINPETGDLKRYYKYVFTFDDEGKVAEKAVTYVSFYYDENNELIQSEEKDTYVYKYEYTDDGYNIIYNYKPWDMNLANGETAECSKQEITFIPFDKTKNYTTTILYYLPDGTIATLAEDEWHDVLCDNSQKTEYVYNSQGYLIEQYAYLADGTKKSIDFNWECEFNEAGNVKNYIEYDSEGKICSKAEYTYDENGNISNIVMELEGQKLNVEIEWMLVPKCIDDVNQMLYGNYLYSISELIEDIIPENAWIDFKDTYYTKEMFNSLIK